MSGLNLFNKIPQEQREAVISFLKQPGTDKLLNNNNFKELYDKLSKYTLVKLDLKYGCKCALTALLLDAGIKPFGEYNNIIDTNVFFSLPIEKYIIPEGVTVIDDFAFNGCLKLKEIYLPKSLEHIGSQAFYHCPNLRYFYYNGTSENLKNILNSDTFVKLSLNKDMAVFANDGGFERNGGRIK